MSKLWDVIKSIAEQFIDVVSAVVDAVWDKLIHPLVEGIFNLLGFEDKTVVNGYVVVQPLYGTKFFNPYKTLMINVIQNNTQLIDEIKNLYISGDQVRIRIYKRYADANGLTTTNTMTYTPIDLVAVQAAIEFEEGETITLGEVSIRRQSIVDYCYKYLANNSGTTGYTLSADEQALTRNSDGAGFSFHLGDPFDFDAVNDAYDINVFGDITKVIQVQQPGAVIVTGSATSTYADTFDRIVVGHAVAQTPAGTTNLVNIMVVGSAVAQVPSGVSETDSFSAPVLTVGNAFPDSDSSSEDEVFIMEVGTASNLSNASTTTHVAETPATTVIEVATAEVATEPTLDSQVVIDAGTPYILQDIIPGSDVTTRYEAVYELNSALGNYLYWYHPTAKNDLTYPDLSLDYVITTDQDKLYVLPFTAIKEDDVWLADSPLSQEYLDNFAMVEKYGLNLDDLTQTFKDAQDSNQLRNIYLGFGLNIVDVASDPALEYLYNYFEQFSLGSDPISSADYLRIKALQTECQTFIDSVVEVPEGDGAGSVTYTTTQTNPSTTALNNEIKKYYPAETATIDAFVAASYVEYEWVDDNFICTLEDSFGWCKDPVGYFWGLHKKLIKDIETKIDQYTVKYTITSGSYNQNISFGPPLVEAVPGQIDGSAEVGFIKKTIQVSGFKLILEKQTDPGTYTRITIQDLASFTMVTKGATEVALVALDFVGSEASGSNVKNNFTVPLIYGFLAEMGIMDRKQILFEAASFYMLGIQVTYLRYYETASFLNFIGPIVQIAGLIYAFYTGDFSTAQILFNIAKYYAGKLLIEKIIQEIILKNPDSKLAQIAALAIAIVGTAALGGGDLGFDLETLLMGVQATSTVSGTINQIKLDKLIDSSEEFLQDTKERQEKLEKARDYLMGDDEEANALLDYVKEQVKLRFESPENFFARTLETDTTSAVLDLGVRLDLDLQLDLGLPSTTEFTR